MEAGDVVNIYIRSVITKSLLYTKYLGDGASKAFKAVAAIQITQ